MPIVTISPIGPALSHSTPTAVTSANAINPSARPSLRCSGSSSRVRPTVRASPPTAFAARSQPPRTADPEPRLAPAFAAPPLPPVAGFLAGVREDDAVRVRADDAPLAPDRLAPEPVAPAPFAALPFAAPPFLAAEVRAPEPRPPPEPREPPDVAPEPPDPRAAPPRPFVTDPLAMSPR